MIPDEKYEKSLGEAVHYLNKEQITKLRNLQYNFANLFFDLLVLKGNEKIREIAVGGVVCIHKKNGNLIASAGFVFVRYSYSRTYDY